jgi:hypothetical protein
MPRKVGISAPIILERPPGGFTFAFVRCIARAGTMPRRLAGAPPRWSSRELADCPCTESLLVKPIVLC